MSQPKYQYENLLRPPYERWSAAMYGLGVLSMVTIPELLMMPPSIAYVGAGLFSLKGLMRYRASKKITTYQKQLVRLTPYTLSSNEVGTSYQNLWIGKGFRWSAKHTQRMYNLTEAKNEHFKLPSSFYQTVRAFERRHEHSRYLHPLLKFTQSQSFFNLAKPLPDLGGDPALHSVGLWEKEEDIYIPLRNRNGHALVLGTTRVGKTRLLEVMVAQDIRRGDTVIVIDPKGDADLLLRIYAECIASNRIDAFHIFHLGFPEISDAYNPIGSFMRMTEVASRVAGQMPGEGQAASFRDFVWGYVNTIAASLITMGIVPTYDLIKTHSENLEPLFVDYMTWYFNQKKPVTERWEGIVTADTKELSKPAADRSPEFNRQWKTSRSMQGHKPSTIALYKYYSDHPEIRENVATLLCSKINYDKSHMDKLTASLQPFLDKMTTGKAAEILIPGQGRSSFNWNDILLKNGVVYVGLDALSDPEVAATVGNSMLSDLTSIAGRIYKTGKQFGMPDEIDDPEFEEFSKHSGTKSGIKPGYEPKICLHADEFNELIGDEFIPMLNKAGGAGVQVTAYTQTLPDIESRLGSKAKAGQVIGNFNTLIMLRVLDPETTQLMVNRQPKVQVVTTDTISGSADNSHVDTSVTFTSSTTQRITKQTQEMLSTNDLLKIPTGQAFALLNGNQLYKVRMPLPDPNDLKGIPKDIVVLADKMRSNYVSKSEKFQFREYLSEEILNSQPIRDPNDIGYAAIAAEGILIEEVIDQGAING